MKGVFFLVQITDEQYAWARDMARALVRNSPTLPNTDLRLAEKWITQENQARQNDSVTMSHDQYLVACQMRAMAGILLSPTKLFGYDAAIDLLRSWDAMDKARQTTTYTISNDTPVETVSQNEWDSLVETTLAEECAESAFTLTQAREVSRMIKTLAGALIAQADHRLRPVQAVQVHEIIREELAKHTLERLHKAQADLLSDILTLQEKAGK